MPNAIQGYQAKLILNEKYSDLFQLQKWWYSEKQHFQSWANKMLSFFGSRGHRPDPPSPFGCKLSSIEFMDAQSIRQA